MVAPVISSTSGNVTAASTTSFSASIASVTAGNALLLVFSFAPHASGSAPTFTISDSAGGTWSAIVTGTGPDSTSYYQGVTAWALTGASAGTHTLTVTASGQTLDGVAWHLMQLPAGSCQSGGASTAVNVSTLATASGTPTGTATAIAAVTNSGTSTAEGITNPPSGWSSEYAQQNGSATGAPFAPIEIALKTGATGSTSTSWGWTSGAHTAYSVLVFHIATAGASLAANAASVSTVTAALKVGARLAANAASVSTVTAALKVGARLAANAVSVSTVTAGLRVGASMAANPVSVSSVTAALTTSIRLSAAMASASSITANLTAVGGFAAAAVSSSTLSASLSTGIRLAAGLVSMSSLSATLTTGIRLAAAAISAPSITAALSAQIRLSAQLASASSMSADLVIPVYTPALTRMVSPDRSASMISPTRTLRYARPAVVITSPARDSAIASPDRII